MKDKESGFEWKFHRLGGLDQVTLRTAEELRHLGELDPKLWVALSCPTSGLEFDQRTLTLIDTDNDGRIRIPEVISAVEWACAKLKDPASLVDPPEAMPLAEINDDSEEGRKLLAAARVILKNLGRPEAESLGQAEIMEVAAKANQNVFNGDGILPPLAALETEVRDYISDALNIVGGVEDAGGQAGINHEINQAFNDSLNRWRQWREAVGDAESPFGEDTPEAWDLMRKLKVKIDDYFLRSELAAFSPQSVEVLNSGEQAQLVLASGLLDLKALAEMPLALVEADLPLSLNSGLNPAWRKNLERFFSLTRPLRAQENLLTRDDWLKIQNAFSAYSEVLAKKPEVTIPSAVDVPPSSSLEELGNDRIAQILDGQIRQKVENLLNQDLAAPGASTEIAALERLVVYHRHLYRLLMNFVSFYDFYSDQHRAAFQMGTLYLDGRGCSLCLPVDDPEKHFTLASFSQLCLLYLNCRRRQKSGDSSQEGQFNIVAAMTAGDSDMLMVGRNGVYVDNEGHDWDATVIKMVPHTISLWQAVWEPYKKVGRMISDQVNKLASGKNDKLLSAATQKISALPASLPPAAPASGFDIGKSVGIFAAIGLALGAIGTAVASIARAFFSLSWWEIPLVFIGLFLLISGPSLVIAWFKLRKRTVGPLLEASGWAVNSRVPINLSLGRQLTHTANLPDNSTRSFNDPLKPPAKWPWVLLAVAALTIGSLVGWFWLAPKEMKTPDSSVEVGAPAAAESAGPVNTGTEPSSSPDPPPQP